MNGQAQAGIDIMPMIERTIANAINQMLFGFSFHTEKEKEVYGKMKKCLTDFQNMITWPSITFALSYPWVIAKLPYFKGKMDYMRSK